MMMLTNGKHAVRRRIYWLRLHTKKPNKFTLLLLLLLLLLLALMYSY